MTLSRFDKEVIKEIVHGAVADAVKPIGEMLVQHDLTLYGKDGRSGQCGDMESMKSWRNSVNIKIAAVGGGAGVIVALIDRLFK